MRSLLPLVPLSGFVSESTPTLFSASWEFLGGVCSWGHFVHFTEGALVRGSETWGRVKILSPGDGRFLPAVPCEHRWAPTLAGASGDPPVVSAGARGREPLHRQTARGLSEGG